MTLIFTSLGGISAEAKRLCSLDLVFNTAQNIFIKDFETGKPNFY